jgi:hypothetical protein
MFFSPLEALQIYFLTANLKEWEQVIDSLLLKTE